MSTPIRLESGLQPSPLGTNTLPDIGAATISPATYHHYSVKPESGVSGNSGNSRNSGVAIAGRSVDLTAPERTPINKRASCLSPSLSTTEKAIVQLLPMTEPVESTKINEGECARVKKLSDGQQTVAVKLLKDEIINMERKHLREKKGEVLGLNLPNHPNIVETLAILLQHEANNEYRLIKQSVPDFSLSCYKILACVLEYVDASDLCDSISDEKAQPGFQLAVDVGSKICDALMCIHEQDMVHRDIKPENILYAPPEAPGEESTVKLTDMGFTKQLKQGDYTRTSCGTPDYTAPEIIFDKKHDHTADAWSLGVLLFVLYTGGRLYDSDDEFSVLKEIKSFSQKNEAEKRLYMLSKDRSISPELLNIMLSLFQKPKQRMTVKAAKEALDRLQGSKQ